MYCFFSISDQRNFLSCQTLWLLIFYASNSLKRQKPFDRKFRGKKRNQSGEEQIYQLSHPHVIVFLASICSACAKHVLLLRMLILIKEEDESINDGCLLISRRLDFDERPGECGLGSDANTTERNVGQKLPGCTHNFKRSFLQCQCKNPLDRRNIYWRAEKKKNTKGKSKQKQVRNLFVCVRFFVRNIYRKESCYS